jgi:hypothetical protein
MDFTFYCLDCVPPPDYDKPKAKPAATTIRCKGKAVPEGIVIQETQETDVWPCGTCGRNILEDRSKT